MEEKTVRHEIDRKGKMNSSAETKRQHRRTAMHIFILGEAKHARPTISEDWKERVPSTPRRRIKQKPKDKDAASTMSEEMLKDARAPPKNRDQEARTRRSSFLMLRLDIRVQLLLAFIEAIDREALAQAHRALRFGHQGIADILLAAVHPAVEALLAERPHGAVELVAEELLGAGRRVAHEEVDVGFELGAELFEGQIVDVHAEGVLDFASDGGEADDDVRCEDASGDRDPAEVVPQLEWEHQYVDPGDLRDGDGVGDWERG